MKKLLLALAAIVVLSAPAFADVPVDPNFYTSATSGGIAQHDFFATDNIWLNLTLPSSNFSITSYLFTDPAITNYYSLSLEAATSNHFLLNSMNLYAQSDVTQSNPLAWSSIVAQGLWQVSAGYNYPVTPTIGAGGYVADFRIVPVPEPISASLFLLGGGALAMIRRKKA